MATLQEEILQKQAQAIASALQDTGSRQQLLTQSMTNQNKLKLDYVMKMDAQLKAQLSPVLADPTLDPAKMRKNAEFVTALRLAYFNKIVVPAHNAAKEEQENQNLLEYTLKMMAAKQMKRSAKIEPSLQLLDERNTEGEDLETDLSDEQIEKILENDPDVPDDLGGNDKVLEELREEAEVLEKKMKDVPVDPTESTRDKFIELMNHLKLYAEMKPSPDSNISPSSVKEQEASKRNSLRPRPDASFKR